MSFNSLGSQFSLTVLGQTIGIHRLDALYPVYPAAAHLPFSIKILLVLL